jgi:cell division protein FtsL
MKRPRILITLILGIIIALSVVRIGIENSISTTGIELVALQESVEKYKKENALLSERYLEESSLTKIASVAAEKGFVQAKNQMYLSAPLPLALKKD